LDKSIIHHVLLVLGIAAIAPIAIANQALAEERSNVPQSAVEPSLWWKVERLQAGWVDDILIDNETKQAIVKINTSRWISADYLQRFSFLFKLGTEAQKQNFNVVLHDRRRQKIAEYSTIEAQWQIDPKSLGAEPFRVIPPTILQQQF
jgi:hypothetical protein